MEEAAGVRYAATSAQDMRAARDSPILVRYADDLVACCFSERQAHQVKARLAEWLEPRGLAFNEDKTRVVHLEAGFLAVTRKSQEAVIAVIRTLAETVRTVSPKLASVYEPLTDNLPKLPSVGMPFADKLPEPEDDAVARAYDFAEQLLASGSSPRTCWGRRRR